VLSRGRVTDALEAKRDILRLASTRHSETRDRLGLAWDRLSELTCAQIDDRIGGVPWPGARPMAELDFRGPIVHFEQRWATAQEARAWALETLRGVTTVAVDGSQIAASREYGVPVGLVQVAWFENPHDPDIAYVKDICNEILAPDDPPEEVSEYAFAEARLNQRRYILEVETAAERLLRLDPERTPVVFHDGSFVLSFTTRMQPAMREAYLAPLFALLDRSRERRVPAVGYVDSSLASDLTAMLRHVFDLPEGTVPDGSLLAPRLGPLDRTAAFQSARADILPQYRREDRDYARDLCFIYLQTGHDRLPARLDFPRWVLDEGLLDRIVDIIRAEIVVGSGYPYALEAADAAAVLTMEDRQAFYRLWQEFATSAGLGGRATTKTASKAHRR
jgi:hypothetical protein